jgi:hypothetical protein
MVQPCLEVIGRGLDDHRRLESVLLHSLDTISGKVIDEGQTMRPSGPDIDVRTIAVLVAQPFDCLFSFDCALPLPEDHLIGSAPDTEVEAFAAHRAKLLPHHAFDNDD